MAFGGFSRSDNAPMSEINMVPLIDVMLVLLVIFMVTAPLLTHSIKIELPQAEGQRPAERPETITLALRADGSLYWNNRNITQPELRARLAQAARLDPQPELHLRADKTTPYQNLAEVLGMAQHAGVHRVGFITEPGGK